VELFSQKLNRPPFQNAVLVHHASLPKKRREEMERLMNNSDRAILCATSTLELGIDIGDVDCIVLYRPPFDISSLLQRIGRGNRRTEKLFALGVYTDNWEKILFQTFFECAQQGRLYEKRYQSSLSIIPQQIYSYLYQRRRIGSTLRNIYNVMTPIYTEDQIKSIFKKLVDDSKIKEFRPGIYFDSYELEKKIEWGKIHSNIPETSFGEFDVFDITSGAMIGKIFYLREKFILGGKCWQTVQISEKEKKVYAKFIGDASAVAKIFEGKGAGNYNYLLAPVLKNRIFPTMGLYQFPYSYDGKNTNILHLFGSLYGFILADGLCEEGIDAIDIEGKIVILNRFRLVDDHLPFPSVDSIRKVISDNVPKLEDALGSGAFFYDLPVNCRIEDHILNLDIAGFLEFLSSIRLESVEPDKFRKTLERLKA
jgi:ATP-dependent Lhr-like helicase